MEIGADVTKVKVGDRVLVPFNIACGECHFCRQGMYGNCHESNTEATAVGAIFGYSHTAGGFDGDLDGRCRCHVDRFGGRVRAAHSRTGVVARHRPALGVDLGDDG